MGFKISTMPQIPPKMHFWKKISRPKDNFPTGHFFRGREQGEGRFHDATGYINYTITIDIYEPFRHCFL